MGDRIRILIVSRYARYPSWQGSAQHARTFASALLSEGHDVRLVSGEDVLHRVSTWQDGYRLDVIPMLRPTGRLEAALSVAMVRRDVVGWAQEILREWRPAVVHVGAFAQLAAFIVAANAQAIPVVGMVNSYEWVCLTKFLRQADGEVCDGPAKEKCAECVTRTLSWKRRVASRAYAYVRRTGLCSVVPHDLRHRLAVDRGVEEALSRLAQLRRLINTFVAQNGFTRHLLMNMGIPPDRIALVRQWLVEEKRKRYRSRPPGERGRPLRIGYAGHLTQWKGLDVLGRALRRLPDLRGTELWIISVGATREKVEVFTGPLPARIQIRLVADAVEPRRVAEALAQLDVLVVPSTCRETGPRTLLEAIAQGTPVIASSVVGNAELLEDQVNSRLVPPGDEYALADALLSLIRNPETLQGWSLRLPRVRGKEEWFAEILKVHERVVAEKSSEVGAQG